MRTFSPVECVHEEEAGGGGWLGVGEASNILIHALQGELQQPQYTASKRASA